MKIIFLYHLSHFYTDFLRHAPCMRHVKAEYEQCSKRYQITMNKISQTTPNEQELQRQQYEQRYNQHNEQHFNNTRSEDEGIEGIKAVCW